MPKIIIVGGCNGSGKTTLARTILPSMSVIEFVNADQIAAELSPQDPNVVAIAAGRLMLRRLQTLAQQGIDFAFETTLAACSFAPFLKSCQDRGYQLNLIYVWLETEDLAVDRVAMRVAAGGHSIPEPIIRRRYKRGRRNFLELYSPLANYWIVYDNSSPQIQAVAEKTPMRQTVIYQHRIWRQIAKETL